VSIHPVVAEIDAIDQRDARITEIRRPCDKCRRRGIAFFYGYYLCRLCLWNELQAIYEETGQ